MDVIIVTVWGLLALVGIAKLIGIPPVSYWFHCKTCPTCNGVGFIKKRNPHR